MTEGEIYRKSGANEAIGSVSGSPLEKTESTDQAGSVDSSVGGDKDIEEDAVSKLIEDTPDTREKLLIHGKARFSVSEGVPAGPFAERIRKLRKAVASVMEKLGHTNE
tara:strand:- start:8100 stop:8423 length:324 start_codon:yes stop_codon:yes gene_type:complete